MTHRGLARDATLWVSFLLLGLGSGCTQQDPAGPSAVQQVPAPDLTGAEPQVTEALGRARSDVLEHLGSAEAWGTLATLFDAHGLLAEAEQAYGRAVLLAPREFRWAYLLAIVREIRGADAVEVAARFDEAARLRPDYVPLWVRLGDALSVRAARSGSLEAFAKALELSSDNAMARRGLGQVLLGLDDVPKAVEQLEQAARLEPRDGAVYASLAKAYMRLGRAEDARLAAERSRGLQPINALGDAVYGEEVYSRSLGSSRVFGRAMAAIRDGQYGRAVEDLQLVLAARAEDASVHYWLGTALARLDRIDEAMPELARAVELNGKLVKAHVLLADLLVARGRFDEAVWSYRRALELVPGDPAVRRGLARALEGVAGNPPRGPTEARSRER